MLILFRTMQLLVLSDSFLFSTTQKTDKYIELVNLKTINRARSSRIINESFIYVDNYLEKFAKAKSPSHEFPIWHAPKPNFGQPWPRPQSFEQTNEIFRISQAAHFKIINTNCELVWLSIDRYKKRIFVDKQITHVSINDINKEKICRKDRVGGKCIIEYISVTVQTCLNGELPNEYMDESYKLIMKTGHVEITSRETWGLMRALETLAQLIFLVVDLNSKWMAIRYSTIMDTPKYKYRGLMIDTSRHFIPTQILMTNLDAMAMNKLNVFHWHITDDQSFPFKSESHPELYLRGSFNPYMIYDYSMIRAIVEYARQRGIRVIPEIDLPGHTASWAKSRSEIMSHCFNDRQEETDFFGPLNPILIETYKLLNDLYAELNILFPDNYIHIGLDEVATGCWVTDPAIVNFMRGYSLRDPNDLLILFVTRLQAMINLQYPKKKMIVWQEAYQKVVNLSKNTIVQIWKNKIGEIDEFLKSDYPLIFSSNFYLDHISYGAQWVPIFLSGFDKLKLDKLIGGEACMWNEFQSKETITQIIWPLTSVVADLLWSGQISPLLEVGRNLEEQRCRMLRSNIPVGVANGPGECLFLFDMQYSNSSISYINKNYILERLFSNDCGLLKPFVIFFCGFMVNNVINLVRYKKKVYSISLFFILLTFYLCSTYNSSSYSIQF